MQNTPAGTVPSVIKQDGEFYIHIGELDSDLRAGGLELLIGCAHRSDAGAA